MQIPPIANLTAKQINLISNKTLLDHCQNIKYKIYGFRNKDIRKWLPVFNTGKISRLIKRLKVFGLIKKAGNTYKYYLTKLGKELVITAEKLKKTVLIPALNY